MARRPNPPFNNKRFIGNINPDPKIVHDLESEDEDANACQIGEIKHEHIVRFNPDTYQEAKRLGFKNCKWCIVWPSLL